MKEANPKEQLDFDNQLHKKLLAIQTDLKAPKALFNNFGKYRYRSNESILEALKPHLKEHGLVLSQTDEIVQIGDRYYIKAVSELWDGKSKFQVSAYARESLDKKGMDDSQITGTASSYARKYSLNGLFLIDDTKDADTDEHTKTATKTAKADDDTLAKWKTWIDKQVESFPEQSPAFWDEKREYVVDKSKNNSEVVDYFDSSITRMEEIKEADNFLGGVK